MGRIKETDTRPLGDPNSWSRTHGSYLAGRAYIDEADLTAAQMETRWGAGRLRLLVSPEMREKFDRQRYLLSAAIWHGDLEAVRREAKRMVTAWVALDKAATEAGKAAISPLVWEVALQMAPSPSSSPTIIMPAPSSPRGARWPSTHWTKSPVCCPLTPTSPRRSSPAPVPRSPRLGKASAIRWTPSATALASTTPWTTSPVQPSRGGAHDAKRKTDAAARKLTGTQVFTIRPLPKRQSRGGRNPSRENFATHTCELPHVRVTQMCYDLPSSRQASKN